MSAFDPTSILDIEMKTGFSTHTVPVPEGDETLGMIEDEKSISAQQFTKEGKVSTLLTIMWLIDDEAARQATGMDKPKVKQTLWLDLDTEGRIDMSEGANVRLGKLLDALGLNDGRAFSFRDLIGQMGKLRIRHRADKDDAEQLYAEVKGVAAA